MVKKLPAIGRCKHWQRMSLDREAGLLLVLAIGRAFYSIGIAGRAEDIRHLYL